MVYRMPSTGDFKMGQTPIPLQREFINVFTIIVTTENNEEQYVKDC